MIIRHQRPVERTHLSEGGVLDLRDQRAVLIGCYCRRVDLIGQEPSEYVILSHGNGGIPKGIVLAGVQVDPIGLHLVGGAGIVGHGLADHRFDRRAIAIVEKTNLPFATLMLLHGIPWIIFSRRLGHFKPSVTLDIYGHCLPGMQSEATAPMDQLVIPIAVTY